MREKSKEVYISLVSSGTPISPKEFAKRSFELLGEEVPYETIRDWYKKDDWASSVVLSDFGDSEEVSRTRSYMRDAFNALQQIGPEVTGNDVCSFAALYKKMASKLPEAFYPLIEEEVIQIREILYASYCKFKKKGISQRTLTRIGGVWADLNQFVVRNVEVEEATVPADDLILQQRR